MDKILIIDDDKELCSLIVQSVLKEGIEADFCYSGKDGLGKLGEGEYQLVILDVMMPGFDGFETLEKIREEHHLPILMFTAKNDSASKVRGLRAGADDYLTKPFSYDELSARVRALLRRNSGQRQNVLNLADLTMDLPAHRVSRGGNEILLTSKEYALLEYMLRNQGQALTRSQIADHVWNYNFDYDSNIVDVYIRYLRNKIDKEYSNPLIHTVRGYGYVIKDESEKQ